MVTFYGAWLRVFVLIVVGVFAPPSERSNKDLR
jgi:hypothetical protein